MKTNGSSLFWIDASTLESLARRASGAAAAVVNELPMVDLGSTPASSPEPTRTAEPVGTQSAGPSPAAPATPAPPAQATPAPATPAPATPAPASPAPSTSATPAPPAPEVDAGGNLESRLQSLMQWLVGFDIESAFVVDNDGLALIHHQGETPMMAAAAAVKDKWAQISQRLRLASDTAMVLHLDSGSFLHLVGAHTPWGRLCLGILGPQLLSHADLSDVHDTFDRLVGENTGTP